MLAHSFPHDLHKSQRAALLPFGSCSQSSLSLDTHDNLVAMPVPGSAGLPSGPGTSGDAEAGDRAPHFGRHIVTGTAPCATNGGLHPRPSSCVDSQLWMALWKNGRRRLCWEMTAPCFGEQAGPMTLSSNSLHPFQGRIPFSLLKEPLDSTR